MSEETKRHLSYNRTKYEEGTARRSKGHTGMLEVAKRGSDRGLEKAFRVKPTIKEWLQENRLVVEVALNPG